MDTVSIVSQDFSIFVDLEYRRRDGSGKVKLFGEELKQLLKGHTFHFEEIRFWVRRRFESD
jgi:hypothetical protein